MPMDEQRASSAAVDYKFDDDEIMHRQIEKQQCQKSVNVGKKRVSPF